METMIRYCTTFYGKFKVVIYQQQDNFFRENLKTFGNKQNILFIEFKNTNKSTTVNVGKLKQI